MKSLHILLQNVCFPLQEPLWFGIRPICLVFPNIEISRPPPIPIIYSRAWGVCLADKLEQHVFSFRVVLGSVALPGPREL